MVDSIKNQSRLRPPQNEKQLDRNGQAVDNNNLRTNFKNISSGLTVAETANPEASKRTANETVPENHRVGQLLRSLNDAVSFSTLALKSLEQVTTTGVVSAHAPEGVKAFSKDLTKVRDNIQRVLEDLKDKADTADVLRENYTSADSQLTDVEAAQNFAAETGSQIHSLGVKAINAHTGLTPETVASLLAE